MPLGILRVSNFYKIRPIFKGEQLLQNKGLIERGNFYKKIEKIEEMLPFFSKLSSNFSNFYKIRVVPGTKSNFYKISLEFRANITFTKIRTEMSNFYPRSTLWKRPPAGSVTSLVLSRKARWRSHLSK